ncbi:MAG: efflux RND transporter periplasmic adaptor subunit [Planctomycetales bacterium]|nr:efflux RND transporter periplasmic adaptor subunit [Planctomycetales bacterium]
MTTQVANKPRHWNRIRKAVLTILFGVGLLLTGGAAFLALASMRKPPAEREVAAKVFNVEIFRAERLDINEILVGYGTAKADREVVLSAQVTGEVMEVHPQLKVGRKVLASGIDRDAAGRSQDRPGDVLVQIDRDVYQQRVRQVEGKLREDESELSLLEQQRKNNDDRLAKSAIDLKLYEKEVTKVEQLFKQGKIATESDVTKAQLELQRYKDFWIPLENERRLFPIRKEQIERRLATHQADLRLAQLDFERTEIRPPFAGWLSEVHVERGQHIKVGDPLVKLIDASVVEVPVPVALGDFTKIEAKILAGEQPRVEMAEHETAPPRWTGHVVRVSPQADERTRTVKVFVRVDNREQKEPLLPGTFVQARIVGPAWKNVVVIPRDSIVQGRIFVASGDQSQSREVHVVAKLQSFAIVDSGVERGDQVILTNLDVLSDGSTVKCLPARDFEGESKQRLQFRRSEGPSEGERAEPTSGP